MARSIRRMSAAGKSADPLAQALATNGRNFVDHDAAVLDKTVVRAGGKGDTEQRRFGRIAGNRANGDGIRLLEPVVLNDNDGPGLSRVVAATGRDPGLAAFHPLLNSLMASMNA